MLMQQELLRSVVISSAAVVVGGLVALQVAFTAHLSDELGFVLFGPALAYLVAAMMWLPISQSATATTDGYITEFSASPDDAPLWVWTGGLFGALSLVLAMIVVPWLGLAFCLVLMLVGRLSLLVLFKHRGCFGFDTHEFSWYQGLGICLLIAGCVILGVSLNDLGPNDSETVGLCVLGVSGGICEVLRGAINLSVGLYVTHPLRLLGLDIYIGALPLLLAAVFSLLFTPLDLSNFSTAQWWGWPPVAGLVLSACMFLMFQLKRHLTESVLRLWVAVGFLAVGAVVDATGAFGFDVRFNGVQEWTGVVIAALGAAVALLRQGDFNSEALQEQRHSVHLFGKFVPLDGGRQGLHDLDNHAPFNIIAQQHHLNSQLVATNSATNGLRAILEAYGNSTTTNTDTKGTMASTNPTPGVSSSTGRVVRVPERDVSGSLQPAGSFTVLVPTVDKHGLRDVRRVVIEEVSDQGGGDQAQESGGGDSESTPPPPPPWSRSEEDPRRVAEAAAVAQALRASMEKRSSREEREVRIKLSRVAPSGQENLVTLGQVIASPNSSLARLRESIEAELDHVPPFVFLKKGVPIGHRQEARRSVSYVSFDGAVTVAEDIKPDFAETPSPSHMAHFKKKPRPSGGKAPLHNPVSWPVKARRTQGSGSGGEDRRYVPQLAAAPRSRRRNRGVEQSERASREHRKQGRGARVLLEAANQRAAAAMAGVPPRRPLQDYSVSNSSLGRSDSSPGDLQLESSSPRPSPFSPGLPAPLDHDISFVSGNGPPPAPRNEVTVQPWRYRGGSFQSGAGASGHGPQRARTHGPAHSRRNLNADVAAPVAPASYSTRIKRAGHFDGR